MVVSDLHCNVGMASLMHSVITLSHASLVLDAGDTTLDGTPVEQYCDTTFARAVPAGVALVTSPGNHDSDTTSKRYARSGATVLAGSVVTVDGIRILGDHDPSQTRVGAGTTSVAGETVTDAGARLADVACADKTGVDLLLIHNPRSGRTRWTAAACRRRSPGTTTCAPTPRWSARGCGTSAARRRALR